MVEPTYSDLIGIPIFRIHEKLMPWLGVTSVKVSNCLRISRLFTSVLFFVCLLVHLYCTFVATISYIKRGEYDHIGPCLAFIVAAFGCLDKYHVAISCKKSFMKIANEIMRKKSEQANKPKKPIQNFVTYLSWVVYYGFFFTAISWTILPMLLPHSFSAPDTEFPIPEHIARYIKIPVGYMSYTAMYSIATYSALSAHNALGFLATQLKDLNDQIRTLDETNIELLLKSFIERHLELLSLHHEVNIIMADLFFFQCFVAIFLSGATIFLTQFNSHLIKALILGMPLAIGAGMEFTMFCALGEEITQEFSELQRSLYFIPWYKMKQKEKKAIMIIMERSKQRIAITGGGIFHANLNTFIKILHDAFSFYVLIKTIFSK